MTSTDARRSFLDEVIDQTGIGRVERPIDADVVAAALGEHYDLRGELIRIATEKDDTFRLRCADGRDFLVKCAPSSEPADVVGLQTAAMVYVERASPELPAQRVVPTVDGARQVALPVDGARARLLRVLTYLPGELLHSVARTPDHWRLAGSMLGRLTRAMEDFTHPSDGRLLLWDMGNFHRLDGLLEFVTDAHDRRIAERIFGMYAEAVVPALPRLERQAIHGDFSPFNAVADANDPRLVTGIIDFGDTVRSCVLFDVAVGMANLIGTDTDDPWGTAVEFLRGYQWSRPLRADDAALLREIALGRLLLRAMVVYWRATTDSERHAYLLSHADRDWSRLAAACATPAHDVGGALRETSIASDHRPGDC